MMVGARDARRALKSADARPDNENGIVERSGSIAVAGKATVWGSDCALPSHPYSPNCVSRVRTAAHSCLPCCASQQSSGSGRQTVP